ncbi:MAG: hypothetical protein Q7R41_04440, partial [Phycisphaerales bacterium]|nr:hypothetical protein [Phycisphaerales bacterium]
MPDRSPAALASLPSVDRVLRSRWAADLVDVHGRVQVTNAIRAVLSDVRARGHQSVVATGIDDS